MSRRSIIALILCAFGLSTFAQDYDHLVERNLWYSSSNAAGIRQESGNASTAELFSSYTAGGFHKDGDASSMTCFGAAAYGIHHEKNFSMKGSFSFSQQDGKNMYGSMLLGSGRYPVDVYEFTPGTKTLQSYGFEGGISVDIAPYWRLGALMEFSSSNYSKRKDLRYVDYILDMKLSPGVLYHNGAFAAGANLIISRSSENMSPEQIGTSVASYEAFLNKGLWYGTSQLWTGSGVHLNEVGVSGFPISENSYGLGFQAQYGGAFAALSAEATSGVAGEKQTIWYRFPGMRMNANLGWKYVGDRFTHIVKADAQYRSIINNETILEKTTEGGVTLTQEYGSNQVYEGRTTKAGASYALEGKSFEVRSALSAERRKELTSVMYPYTCYRKTSLLVAAMGATVNIWKITLVGDTQFSSGNVKERQRKLNGTSGVTKDAYRLDEWNLRAQEYETAPQLHSCLALRYELTKGLQLSLEGTIIKAYNLQYIEDSLRTTGAVRVIYKF